MADSCVLFDTIEVVGICQDFPNNCQGAFTQLKVNEVVTVPEQKPDIEQISQVLVDGSVFSLRIVETPIGTSLEGQKLTGEKLIIEGKIHQKVVYVADVEDGSQPVHSVEFDALFSTFVVVPECYVGMIRPGKEDRINVQVCIEDLFIEEINPRQIVKSVMLFINAIFPGEEEAPVVTITEPADGDTITPDTSAVINVEVEDNCLLDRLEMCIVDADCNLVDEYNQSLRGLAGTTEIINGNGNGNGDCVCITKCTEGISNGDANGCGSGSAAVVVEEGPLTISHIWDTTGLPVGLYTICVVVYDCAGNKGAQQITVTAGS